MTARIVVIAGGLTPERDVSIRSGRRVAEELRHAGFEAVVLDTDSALRGPKLLWRADGWDRFHATSPLKSLYIGAAGVLFVVHVEDGPLVMLQKRSAMAHEGGTWSIAGGAIDISTKRALMRKSLDYPWRGKFIDPSVSDAMSGFSSPSKSSTCARSSTLRTTRPLVDTQITNLRKKIEPTPAEPTFLQSVRGYGYRFDG